MEFKRQEFLDQSKAHFAADMLVKGTYGDDYQKQFKGCSVGCHLHHIMPTATADEIFKLKDKHYRVATHYGYPEWLALLQDLIFEGLPNGESARWHLQFAETLYALPDQYDWQAGLHRVHAAILRVTYRTAGSAQEAVQRVLDLHERAGRGEKVADELWSAARSAARSAAWSAARSAAWSAAWSAAESAASNAASSAARSTARRTAWGAAYQEIRDVVLAALEKDNG